MTRVVRASLAAFTVVLPPFVAELASYAFLPQKGELVGVARHGHGLAQLGLVAALLAQHLHHHPLKAEVVTTHERLWRHVRHGLVVYPRAAGLSEAWGVISGIIGPNLC